MKKHVTVPAPATIDSIALDKVTGGAGTWKDMRDGAGNSGSKGVGKKSPPPVTVAPSTTIRFRRASGATSPASTEAALIVRIVRRGP